MEEKKKSPVWEDLVNDYLEVSGNLKEPARRYLIRHLKKGRVNASSITQYPSFQVDDTLVVICREPYEECWFFHPEKRKIGKNKSGLLTKNVDGTKAPISK